MRRVTRVIEVTRVRTEGEKGMTMVIKATRVTKECDKGDKGEKRTGESASN